MSFLSKIFGDSNLRAIKQFQPIVLKINAFETEISKLSDEALKNKTKEFKTRLLKDETLEDILPEAFACVREASKRTLGQRHFDVQLIGGMILNKGAIAEMKTGEGKTLVATLPTYLNALEEKGVHIVTVNDYLSRRDAVWMGQIYDFLGLTVGILNHEQSFIYDPKHTNKVQNSEVKNQSSENTGQKLENGEDELDKERDQLGSFKVVHEFLRPCTRHEAYMADITYGTNSEFGFDYLRDNLEYKETDLRQRDYHFAVVDEIDSILIDEARTPLIISSQTSESEELYFTFAKIAGALNKDEDYEVDEKLKAIQLTDKGITKAEKILGVENIYTEKGIKYVHHLETAVRAKALFERDKDYVVRDGEVIIVDEFTGRMQPGRRWSEGLHQAIEAKEGAKVQKESRTFASITYQNFFRLYKKLSGMTGTAMTSDEEFRKVYKLEVFEVPTNKPVVRKDSDDYIFQSEHGKFMAVAKKVKELNKVGQPVLIGTVSIEKNQLLSEYLKREGVPHEVLNAKNHEREGEIVAQAGRKGAVTIATNMAGRGVDIKLGGNPTNKELYEEVKSLGGLFVLGTERHEARRIDNQLRGRSGRQGDPGETQFFVSMEDSLMRVFASDTVKKMMGRLGLPEDQPIENRIITKSLESAQTKIEGFHFDARKHVLEYDDVLNHQRKTIYDRRRAILLGDKEFLNMKLEEILSGESEGARKIILDKKNKVGEEQFLGILRMLLLQTTDMYWVEHLEAMDYLRGSVNLRAYGQRDPLVEYKKEGLKLFKEMESSITMQILSLLPNIGGGIANQEEQKLQEVHEQANVIASGDGSKGKAIASAAKMMNDKGEEIGRNDLCPCGSGKKYKKCHGK